ncbi:hypothetical protein [Micromonospora sp. CP22]|uniref:VHL beta domain-containing protein n=1 Tax=Micromonospora sp. CP22 TaxID=2580517 RepID=UPI0012BCDCF8|nr:hypothetical protein [Micromonospora sp. CP22]MTK02769.1 hypothetical protein [Micromonospora sp. CP22]
MNQSPDHEDGRVEPRLRVGPWLFDPRTRAKQLAAPPVLRALPPAPTPGGDASTTPPPPVREPVAPFEPAHRAPGRMSHRLLLAGLATAVLGLILTVLWPAAGPPPAAAPDVPSGWVPPAPDSREGDLGGVATAAASSPSPAASSSVEGVTSSRPHLSRRATPPPSATRTSSPPRPTTPSTRPVPPPSRPAAPPPTTRPPEPQHLTPLPASRERGLRSTDGGSETSIEFVNQRSRPVTVYWLDHRGQRRQYAVLPPRQSYRQHTYVGHPWVVTDRRGRALACFEPTRTPGRAVIR